MGQRYPSQFVQNSVGVHYDAGSLTVVPGLQSARITVDRRLVHRRLWIGYLVLPDAGGPGTPVIGYRFRGYLDDEIALEQSWRTDGATAYTGPNGTVEPVKLAPAMVQVNQNTSAHWSFNGDVPGSDCMEWRQKYGSIFYRAVVPPTNISGDFSSFELRVESFSDAGAGAGDIILAIGCRSQLYPFTA